LSTFLFIMYVNMGAAIQGTAYKKDLAAVAKSMVCPACPYLPIS
jgi:hypothetical protein